ncbi:hypothetical protein Mal4_22130 [Maioricimonas rarisocia]|uniref:Ferritin-like domain protein n=1 Tax=Maioricimonas rarisocia TaxID=2528026 RepID=A0A517Z616_9PLAN|nr:hypothetical protein [Maioricimonas rarisocia]QDU37894.1 hypothetical protein Mal4_22130 [Maioricimonas rarisocia]
MTQSDINAQLNDLLILIGRNLLQYLGESWPWVGDDEVALGQTVQKHVQEQQKEISQIVDLLERRYHPIDFGAFPTAYTSLHYVAIDYLLDQLVGEQRTLVEEVGRISSNVTMDQDAAGLLREIYQAESRRLEELESLARQRKSSPDTRAAS